MVGEIVYIHAVDAVPDMIARHEILHNVGLMFRRATRLEIHNLEVAAGTTVDNIDVEQVGVYRQCKLVSSI